MESHLSARGRARTWGAAVPGRPPSAVLRRTGSSERAGWPRRWSPKFRLRFKIFKGVTHCYLL
jgi:hypothetical protein